MNWKIFLSTFGVVFLAELGDKTQLAAITLAVETKKPISVFWGAMSAFVVITIISVLFGETLTKFIPAQYLEKIAAVVFILIGLLMLLKKI